MLDVFLQTLPFFAIIGLGYGSGQTGFFNSDATAWLTKFVFYFALSAMLFRFAANLNMAEVFDARLVAGYLAGTAAVYIIATAVAFWRRLDLPQAAVEAQCAVIGNTGFLGLPMFVLLFGDTSIGPMILVLATDLIVFSSLIVILINAGRDGRLHWGILRTIAVGLVQNPMIVAISTGLIWSSLAIPIPDVMNSFLATLGGAATPCALFAIGASLAGRSAERIEVSAWLTFAKLVLHPIFVAIGVLWLFPLDSFRATLVVGAAAMPVAGNIFMLAQHYGIAPQRVSTAILFSTAFSILTVPVAIALVSG